MTVEGDGPLKDLQDRRGRSDEEIQRLANSGQAAPPAEKRIPAPGDPDYEPLEKESPVWEPYRQAQLRYAGEQAKRVEEESSD